MVISTRWNFIMVTLVGAGAYLGLLHISYRLLEHSYFAPQWWRDGVYPRPLASASWFVLINATGAFMAAFPVALGVSVFAKTHRAGVSLLVGVLPGLYVMGGGWADYGRPKHAAAWVVDAFQLLSISLAVLLAVTVIVAIRPRTNGWSERGGSNFS